MGQSVRSFLGRCGVAVLAVALALVVRLALDPVVGDRLPFLTFALAVAAAAWYGGFGPSLLALVLSLLAAVYFFLSPRYDLAASVPAHQVQVIGYVFLGVSLGLFSQGMRSARIRAEANAREAQRRRHELELVLAQQKRLEEELIEAGRRKDEFLAMLGHELRTPLAPMRNAVEVMRVLGLPSTELEWARRVIDRQVAQMARLVDDLLDVSRISRGKIALKQETVELANVIERGIESSRPLVKARGHDLEVTLPAETVWLNADPARLAQVVANLLNNACKYTPAGGKVQLATCVQGDEVVLRVRDNGVGIAREMLPHVFDLFAQADHTLDHAEGGLGIGLTLVKTLVGLHGGRVEAASDGPGKGSEFTVSLPLVRPSPGPAPNGPGRSVAPATPTRRVLAVDDNVDAVESLAVLLSLQGHEVRTAHDGPAALETALAFRPEVVFLDIGLPGIDGYEVARRLRAQEGLKTALLVAVTGYGQEEDRHQAGEAGFDAHVVKPADPAVLQALLCRCRSGVPV
jgi:signal transduction histidine kinase/CheY-like chemotaxis protein